MLVQTIVIEPLVPKPLLDFALLETSQWLLQFWSRGVAVDNQFRPATILSAWTEQNSFFRQVGELLSKIDSVLYGRITITAVR